jgi:hypothetical protein
MSGPHEPEAPAGAELVYQVRCRFTDPGREADWNRWYDEVHVPAILGVPGFRSVTRFAELGRPGHYLAIYAIDDESVFDSPEYAAVRGWGEWASAIGWWSRAVLQRVGPDPARPAGDGQ